MASRHPFQRSGWLVQGCMPDFLRLCVIADTIFLRHFPGHFAFDLGFSAQDFLYPPWVTQPLLNLAKVVADQFQGAG
jgi:hypothetical protein